MAHLHMSPDVLDYDSSERALSHPTHLSAIRITVNRHILIQAKILYFFLKPNQVIPAAKIKLKQKQRTNKTNQKLENIKLFH